MAKKWIGLAFLWMIFLTAASGLYCLLPIQPRFTLPSSAIFFFRLSPDSRSLATLEVDDRYNYGDELGPQRRGPARLWDISTGRESGVLGAEEKITDLLFSPDGKLLALKKVLKGYIDFDLYDLETCQKTTTIRVDTEGYFPEPRFCFSPDGKSFVFETVDKNGTHLKSRDLSTQQEKFILNKTGRMTFSPGGEIMAVIPNYENTLMLIDPKTPEEKRRIKVSKGLAWETLFSPDGKMLAANIERGLPSSIGGLPAVQVWEVETGKELLTLDRRSHPIFFSRWSDLSPLKEKSLPHQLIGTSSLSTNPISS
jgi:Tol biopolymer transport system component